MNSILKAGVLALTFSFVTLVLAPSLRADDEVTPLTVCSQPDPNSTIQEIKCPISAFQGRNPVDILWVVDNSGSMGTSQEQLKQNTSTFISELVVGNAPKWKLGMVSTDVANEPFLGFKPGTLIDYLTPNAVTLFQTAVAALGTWGSATEEMFAPVVKWLDTYPDFLRPNANLAIINLTDADEQSAITAEAYTEYLKQKKGGKLSKVAVFGILGALDNDCVLNTEGWMYAGSKHEKIINATGGKMFQLCKASPTLFSDMMQAVLNTVLNNRLYLGLPNVDVANLMVTDAKRVLRRGPAALGGEWDYDAVRNEVVFTDISTIAGDHIQVVYRLLQP